MRIILNNRQEEFDQSTLSVSELIKVKEFSFRLLVTKINGKLIRKDERETAIIQDGDKVDVIHLISGG
ncbi:MAG: sulfur carrier protein ThiS [Bacteroidetes bacterium]|nr:sulfur carrier protein ThiS [Bacteroidota bacterium]